MKIIKLNKNSYNQNTYIVTDNKKVYIIDPGLNELEILNFLEINNLIPSKIFLTHGHFDHTYGINALYNIYKDIEVYINKDDFEMLYDPNLNVSFFENERFILNKEIKVIKVNDKDVVDDFTFFDSKGHTNGSIIIKNNKYLFTGDTLFKDGVGRTDLPTGNIKDMRETLKNIPIKYSMNSIILPGHGDNTTLLDEIKINHYLNSERRGY